jgi:2'-5' RNA ligase
VTVEKPSAKFFPGFFLDAIDESSHFISGKLPHRITLFPPLQQKYESSFSDELRASVHPLAPFDVTVGETALFGDMREPQLVRLIEPSQQLQLLHATIVRVLGHLIHDEQYRQPYRPHISVNAEEAIYRGTKIHIGGFSVIEKVRGQPWIVVDKIRLKGDDNEITS